MNDHDSIVKISTQLDYLIKEVQLMRDGTAKDITAIFTKIEILEKEDLAIKNEIKRVDETSSERFRVNGERIKNLEDNNKEGVTRKENNIAYWFRLIIERAIVPASIFIGTLLLVKTGILNI